MKKEELDEFRRILSDKQSELQDLIARAREQLEQQLGSGESGEAHVDFNHPADMVGGDPDYDKQLNLLEQARVELVAVREALERIENGSYGVCELCERDIPYPRLKSIPFTKYCVECREMLEQRESANARRGTRPVP